MGCPPSPRFTRVLAGERAVLHGGALTWSGHLIMSRVSAGVLQSALNAYPCGPQLLLLSIQTVITVTLFRSSLTSDSRVDPQAVPPAPGPSPVCLLERALGRCLLLKQGCLAAGRPCRTAAPSTRVSESLAAAGIIRLPLMRDGSHANAYLSKEDFQMETGREGRQHPRLRRITADLSASLLHITTRICCRGW